MPLTAQSSQPIQTQQVANAQPPQMANASILTRKPGKKKKPEADDHDSRGGTNVPPATAAILARRKK